MPAHPTIAGLWWVLALLLPYPLVLGRIRRRGSWSRRRVVTVSIFYLYAVSVAAITVFPVVTRPPELRWDVPWWIVVHWVPFRVEALSFVLNMVMFLPL